MNLKQIEKQQYISLSNEDKAEYQRIKNLYPIIYKDKCWNKADCNSLFIAYYDCEEALNEDGSVYVSDGIYVFPDSNQEDIWNNAIWDDDDVLINTN